MHLVNNCVAARCFMHDGWIHPSPTKTTKNYFSLTSNKGTSTDLNDSTTISVFVRESISSTVSATVNFNPTFVAISSGDNRSSMEPRFPSDIAQTMFSQFNQWYTFPQLWLVAGLGPARHLGFSNIHCWNILSKETAATAIDVDCLAEILQILLLSTQVVIATGSMHQEKQDLYIFMLIQPLIQV